MPEVLMEPSVVAALIAAIVALFGLSVRMAIKRFEARRKLKVLKRQWESEVFVKMRAEEFSTRMREFQCWYRREFLETLERLKCQNDVEAVVQHTLDSYRLRVRPLIELYSDFVPACVKEAHVTMELAVEELKKNFRPNDPSTTKYAEEATEAGIRTMKLLAAVRPR